MVTTNIDLYIGMDSCGASGSCFITISFSKNHKYLKFSHLSFTIDEWESFFPRLLQVKMHWFLVSTQGKDTTIGSLIDYECCAQGFVFRIFLQTYSLVTYELRQLML